LELVVGEARAVGCRAACVSLTEQASHNSAISGQTPRSTITVDSFIDLAELLGC
jgi:hypothetical protein